MNLDTDKERLVTQVLQWGGLRQERPSPASTMFATCGRKLYVLGDIDGRFRPRSNPYDLHAVGRPHPEDPLAEKLQGVWAQPVKGLASHVYLLEVNGERWELQDADTFTQAFAFVEFSFRRGPLRAVRRDLAAQDLPLLLTTHGPCAAASKRTASADAITGFETNTWGGSILGDGFTLRRSSVFQTAPLGCWLLIFSLSWTEPAGQPVPATGVGSRCR